MNVARRALRLAQIGVAALGLLALTGCASNRSSARSAINVSAPATTPSTPHGGDMSNGANNFYTSDRVTMQRVTFKNQYDMNVAGNLFVPEDSARDAKLAAVVVGHPMGAVKDKEQSANLYAAKMAERGFVTLAIDLPFWGESEGRPRQVVSPDLYAEAFSAANRGVSCLLCNLTSGRQPSFKVDIEL